AAIPDVSEEKLPINDGERSTGRSHPVKLGMFDAVTLNRIVSSLKGRVQNALGISVEVPVVDIAHGFDCESAGFLSALVATHAIGDDCEAPFALKFDVRIRFPIEKRIFIVRAL